MMEVLLIPSIGMGIPNQSPTAVNGDERRWRRKGGGRRKEEGGRRKEEGGRREEEGGRKKEEG
jgi:hypothetical protein